MLETLSEFKIELKNEIKKYFKHIEIIINNITEFLFFVYRSYINIYKIF
jgi:hypothetical protein